MFSIWPWDWPGMFDEALRDALNIIGFYILAIFAMIFAVLFFTGRIPAPGSWRFVLGAVFLLIGLGLMWWVLW